MLILYGISSNDALFFVLIVHSIQTLLVILLGIYAWISLSFTEKKNDKVLKMTNEKVFKMTNDK